MISSYVLIHAFIRLNDVPSHGDFQSGCVPSLWPRRLAMIGYVCCYQPFLLLTWFVLFRSGKVHFIPVMPARRDTTQKRVLCYTFIFWESEFYPHCVYHFFPIFHDTFHEEVSHMVSWSYSINFLDLAVVANIFCCLPTMPGCRV